ncbi:transglutaminase-like domain-containing protein [Catenovulum sp. SX2]|uniref:transglutaminase-like domain-containing protein n=1 Tax=Catenovulum sp. SX2 TaxID=3398614 RepID=UPI003F837292
MNKFYFSSTSNEYLTKLRNEFELETRFADSVSQISKIEAIAKWVGQQWQHDGANQANSHDAIEILRLAQQGHSFRCVEYAIVATAVLNSLGFPTRILGLMTEDVESREFGAGHVVAEAYLSELNKWVFIDPLIQTFAMLDEYPLNAVELKNAMQNGDIITFVGFNQQDSMKYQNWLNPYLYYIDISSHTVYAKVSKNQKYRFAVQGAKNPQVFQIKYPISDAILVHSPQSIYQAPTLVD